MPTATENCVLPLKQGLNIEEGETVKTARAMLDTIKAQPGCQRIAWGRQVENPDNLVMFIDWDAVSSHEAFAASATYTPFLQTVGTLLAGAPAFHHIHFGGALPPVTASAPVTEVVSFYFPPNYNTDDFAAPWAEFADVALKNASGIIGASAGWAVELVEHDSLKDEEGGKGKVFTAAIAWESVDKHMEYRDTQAFKDSIPKVRGLAKGASMFHVKFNAA